MFERSTEPSDSYRVLLVDDNEAIHDDYRDLLQQRSRLGDLDDLDDLERLVLGEAAGMTTERPDADDDTPRLPRYTLDSVYQGRDALEAVQRAMQEGSPYALAFVDIRMPPGWDGVTTIEHLWAVDPQLHVVACSAFSDYSWRDMIARLGATDRMLFLRKPFDAGAVKQLALAMTRKWTLHLAQAHLVRQLEGEVASRTRELERALSALESKNAELREANRRATRASAAKSRFLAHMSHELRTPLNSVLGAGELLSRSELDDAQRDLLSLVRRSGETLVSLIGEVLDVSRIESGKLTLAKEAFELRSVIDEAIATVALAGAVDGLGRPAKPEVELAVRIAADVPETLTCDRERVRQVLINLVGNALKFTARGTVVVHAAHDPARSCVRIEVRDTGVGIVETARPHVFDVFVQADQEDSRRFGGMGLGLTISKNLVELMNGRIGVESEPGQGSTFWFELPALPTPRVPHITTNCRALVIAAPSENRATLCAYLDEFGAHVTTFDTVAQARQVQARDCQIAFFDCVNAGEDIPSDSLADHLGVTDAVVYRFNAIGQSTERDHRFESDLLSVPIAHGAVKTALLKLVGGSTADERHTRDSEPGYAVRILVAEDNRMNQRVIGKMLEVLGCEFDVVGNGAEAVQTWRARSYDLVLMDIQMPVMDGWEATCVIRESEDPTRAQVPIIALTASVLADQQSRCYDIGMNDILAKPIGLDELRSLLDRYANRPITGTRC